MEIQVLEQNVIVQAFATQGGTDALFERIVIGASGARIMVTLIHALKSRGLKKGIATLCIGGGEATAVALEMV